MKNIWVTKTRATARTNPVPGHDVLYHPLLVALPPAKCPPPPGHDDVLVFTSANGVSAFCDLTPRRHWPVFAVGDATAATAKNHGFSEIHSAGKDVDALTELIIDTIPTHTRIYYGSAAHVSGDLTGILQIAGYTIKRAILYQTVNNPDLPLSPPATILLYSRKGAMALLQSGLDLKHSAVICISRAVYTALGNRAVKSCDVAKNPNHNSMLKRLDRP